MSTINITLSVIIVRRIGVEAKVEKSICNQMHEQSCESFCRSLCDDCDEIGN